MIDITFILLGITALFALFIGLRLLFALKVCALCAAVSATWIALVALFYVGSYTDPILIAILIGGSIVGAMYLLEQKLPEHFQIFKLPFFLTLVFVTYGLLQQNFEFGAILILVLLWACASVLYAGRDITNLKALGRNIIACCKNW